MHKIIGISDKIIPLAQGYGLCHSFLSLNIDKSTKLASQCNNIVNFWFQEISLTGLLNNSTWGSAKQTKEHEINSNVGNRKGEKVEANPKVSRLDEENTTKIEKHERQI